MGQCCGGASLGANWTPHVRQMYCVSATRARQPNHLAFELVEHHQAESILQNTAKPSVIVGRSHDYAISFLDVALKLAHAFRVNAHSGHRRTPGCNRANRSALFARHVPPRRAAPDVKPSAYNFVAEDCRSWLPR